MIIRPTLTPRRAATIAAMCIMATSSHAQTQTSNDSGQKRFDFPHVAALRNVTDLAIAPDGDRLAAIVQVPRDLETEDDGAAWRELHVTDADGRGIRPYIQGRVKVSSPQFTADGKAIAFRAKRRGDKTFAVWALPVDGGEARKVLKHKSGIRAFRLSPDGEQIAFMSPVRKDKNREKARKRGYDGIVFEEDARPVELYVAPFEIDPPAVVPGEAAGKTPATAKPRKIEVEGSVFDFVWSADGTHLLVAAAPTPLVDDGYMSKRLRLVRIDDAEVVARFETAGKLGQIGVAPDDRHVAMIAGADWSDPKQGRLMVARTGTSDGGDRTVRDLMPDLEGHISAFAWQSADRLLYVADLGTETEVGTVGLDGQRQPLFDSGTSGAPIAHGIVAAADGNVIAFRGERPEHPNELFRYRLGSDAPPERLTDSNPWLADLELAPQRLVRWTARDGLELEGILIEPLGADGPKDGSREGPAPLIMIVHGGPESHVRNGWQTAYSRPSQLLAAQGYAVFHPNYRGSTGRGVAFSKRGQGDAAGSEFDDLIDAIDHLIDTGVADGDRIGVTGGSYGGYATAWLSTRYSDRIRAGVMFNGISNKHSKALTTDIPEEDRAVHTLYDPWTRGEYALSRSPLGYVADATTPLLIVHGMADTRVHPSQSLQLYRALKMVGKAPVRMVRYPGEPHGNRRQATKEDYTRRLVRWMNHFIKQDTTELPAQQIDHVIAKQDDDSE